MDYLNNILPLTPKTILADWRREVKYNNIDEFWKAIERDMKQLLNYLLENTMEEEITVYTKAEWNHKCGTQDRLLLEKFGAESVL